MIIVRLPSGLRAEFGAELSVEQQVDDLGALIEGLARMHPALREHLHDSLYNFAVNDTLILHGADAHPLRDGDVVELIPTIAGG